MQPSCTAPATFASRTSPTSPSSIRRRGHPHYPRCICGIGRPRDVRARRSGGLAPSPAGPDPDRDGGLRLGPAMGWSNPGNPGRRCRLDPASEEPAMRGCSRPTGHRRADDDERRHDTTRAALAVLLLSLLASACAHASPGRAVSGSGAPSVASSTETVGPRSEGGPPMLPLNEIRRVAPALEKYTQGRLLGEVWKRPGLAPRDRSIVTLAALIARNQMIEMPYYLNLALDNGVEPREMSEIITHLAFYSGWPNAMSAVAVAKEVFAQRIPQGRRGVSRGFCGVRGPERGCRRRGRQASLLADQRAAGGRNRRLGLGRVCAWQPSFGGATLGRGAAGGS